MVWDNCTIVLHGSSNGSFFTNDIVTGTVTFEVKKQRKVEHIEFKVRGTSKAMWSRPAPTVPYIKIYSEKNDVFSVIVDVLGDLKGTIIKPGIITRQFHFFLPPDLPPTYKDSVAAVFYRIKIRSKNSYRQSKEFVCPLNVANHVDLNFLDEYKIPMVYEMTKKIGKSRNLTIFFKTYKGFTRKQLIPFEAIITNEQKVKLRNIKVYLIQKLEYNVTAGFKNSEKAICRSVYKDLLNIATQTCYFHMEVPDVIPSTINVTDPMVTISYILRVKVSFVYHLSLQSEIPITISTVPIDYYSFI